MKYKAIAFTKNFKLKLEKRTNEEASIWFFTPKILNDKPFCGKVENSTSNLSLNSFMPEQKVVSIKGTFKEIDENEFLVEFSVGISFLAKIWNISIFILALTFINFMDYKNKGNIGWIPNIAILSLALFGFIILYAIIDRAKSKFVKELGLIGLKKLK